MTNKITNKLKNLATFHGIGWKKRTASSLEERQNGLCWSLWQSNSEYKQLKAVLLFAPGKEIHNISDSNKILHIKKINSKKIKLEFLKIKKAFEKEGVLVFQINPGFFADPPPPNLMYVRDLFWNGIEGAVISRMGSQVRIGEEKYAAATLSMLSIPIIGSIHQKALFEGADLLWLNHKTLLCGVGNRTNLLALKQLEDILKCERIKIVPISLPKNVQHLLGILQIVDRKKALIRTSLAPKKLISLLKKEKFELIEIPESHEVVNLQGMNIVTIRPNEIFMPCECPELKKIYSTNHIKVLAELDIEQILCGAGGLACATGILSRTL
ncbi:MAG: hypothetical protein H7281_12980 [Bacteriovorax sp.]|nr:hypothetical protein [Bacteriovorax sp.]